MNFRHLALAGYFLLSADSYLVAQEPAATKADTFWVIPHTHWEGAVFKTREEYLEMGLPHLLKAMRLLREQPDFKFTLDQVAYVRPFLERYPGEEADFRKFLAAGRLQLVGALDVMPDVNMPGGETFIRQMQYGKGYYRKKFGVDVTTGWLIDTFGHHAQMPQLMALGGYTSYWFVRGVPRQEHPAEFFWEGIDGTRIAAFYLPHSYALMYGSPNEAAPFRTFAEQQFASLAKNARGPHRVGLAGPDVTPPEDHLAPRIALFNRDPTAPFKMKIAVPADFEAACKDRSGWPVFKGELNPIFQGTYSSRIELKSWMRTAEQRLLTAEKLSALARWHGVPADRDALASAWEPVLFNETHDLASGVMTDHVYDDTIRGYEYSARRAGAIIDDAWNALAARIDTRGPGAPILVWNTLGWTRSDVVEADLGFGMGGVAHIGLTDGDGQTVPSQVVAATRYGDGSLQTARIAFVARDVPALGYRVFHVAIDPQSRATTAPSVAAATNAEPIETDFYRASFDLATGALTSLRLKADNWEAFDGPANVVARSTDHGDLWELEKGLDGASRVAMTNKQNVPTRTTSAFSDQGKSEPAKVAVGPVFAEVHAVRPFGSGQIATTTRIYRALRRIDITTRLVNREKFVRYQALFPTTIKGGKNTHEIPFGSIDRPDGIEFPAQNWVDQSDGQHGLALANAGLPGNVASGGTLMLSLLRSHTLGAYGFGGGFEPGMSSDTGLELGQERVLRYALIAHKGDWRAAGVFRDGLELNHPLIARSVLPHAGSLPGRWGFVEVSTPAVVVSAVQPGQDGSLALRVHEATGKPDPNVAIKLAAKLLSAHETNLLGDRIGPLALERNVVKFALRAYEIKTIQLTQRPD